MNNDRKQDLTARLAESVEYLNRQVHRGRLEEWGGLDMSIAQIKTLVLLESTGPVRMGDIAAFLGRALSATTSVVDRLVARGLVVRASDASDRRVVVCQLTDEGEQEVARLWRVGREHVQVVADRLEVEELEAVVRAIELICEVERERQPGLAPQSAG